jgi:hypothetical protein
MPSSTASNGTWKGPSRVWTETEDRTVRALIEECKKNHSDTAPLLALADYLEEHGNEWAAGGDKEDARRRATYALTPVGPAR